MKLSNETIVAQHPWSLPVRGAWIEIIHSPRGEARGPSLPVRGAWIEIIIYSNAIFIVMSLPVRGAWIEINVF